MKARVKSTGVLVDVTPQLNINSQHSRDYLYVCDNMVFKECELDNTIVGYASSEADYKKGEEHTIPISIARFAIACADALINELK